MKLIPVLVALTLPWTLHAQDPRLERLGPPLAAAVERQLDSARTAGLPTEPLIQKALEGRGKGATDERIIGAVRTLRTSLAAAQATLGAESAPTELVAAANALRAGASREALAQIRRARSGDLTVPLDVLTDLIARGIPSATAAAAVGRLVHQGADDRDLTQLRQRVEQDIRAGTAPGVALERRMAGIPAAGPPQPP